MPDGRRKRRFSLNTARRRWYAEHRSRRFGRRFWVGMCGCLPTGRTSPVRHDAC